MLTLIDTTTIQTMIQCQVSDALGNLKANKNDGSNKEGNQLARTYQEFLNSEMGSFYGDREVDGLNYQTKEIEIKWASEHKFKFATCMFMVRVLLWWTIDVKALGVDRAYETSW